MKKKNILILLVILLMTFILSGEEKYINIAHIYKKGDPEIPWYADINLLSGDIVAIVDNDGNTYYGYARVFYNNDCKYWSEINSYYNKKYVKIVHPTKKIIFTNVYQISFIEVIK
jgi:hypothetical protein